jgi:hypothetical protein
VSYKTSPKHSRSPVLPPVPDQRNRPASAQPACGFFYIVREKRAGIRSWKIKHAPSKVTCFRELTEHRARLLSQKLNQVAYALPPSETEAFLTLCKNDSPTRLDSYLLSPLNGTPNTGTSSLPTKTTNPPATSSDESHSLGSLFSDQSLRHVSRWTPNADTTGWFS